MNAICVEPANASAVNSPKLLSAQEAAESLGVSLRYLRELVKKGHVAVVRIGGRTLFSPADLHEFIASHRVPARERN